MRVYFDSSAFAKRYIDETGTGTVLAWCERASELALYWQTSRAAEFDS